MNFKSRWMLVILLALALAIPGFMLAQQRGSNSPFPGGANPDGSLRPDRRLSSLFTQDAYTEYALLDPSTQSFRIRFLPEETRVGATTLVNATRAGSKGENIEVYDPRTGKPVKFEYILGANGSYAIHAQLPIPVPEGGVGRVLIYKTYLDARSYTSYAEANPDFGIQAGDISWVRSLSGYRLGVILPKGYSFLSSNVAAQISTLPDGRLKVHFANPSGLSNPFTVHARKTTTQFAATAFTDMFFDDVKTLYDLDQPESHTLKVQQIYSNYQKGEKQKLELLTYAPLQDLKVIDLDTAKPLITSKEGNATVVKLEVPIVDDKQSAHLKLDGKLLDANYKVVNGTLTFDQTMKGLRNTVLLPAGWDVASVSQSGIVGIYQGRVFVAFINLNAENQYRVSITARKKPFQGQ